MSDWFVDIEKTINGLENLREICKAKSDMSVGKGKILWAGYAKDAEDAIALLKEKEAPSKEELISHYGKMYKCKRCGLAWYQQTQKYCQECGTAVKFE